MQGVYNPFADNPNANQSVTLNNGDTLTLTDQYSGQDSNATISIVQNLTGNGQTAATPISTWNASAHTLTIQVLTHELDDGGAILTAVNSNTVFGGGDYNPFQAAVTTSAGGVAPNSDSYTPACGRHVRRATDNARRQHGQCHGHDGRGSDSANRLPNPVRSQHPDGELGWSTLTITYNATGTTTLASIKTAVNTNLTYTNGATGPNPFNLTFTAGSTTRSVRPILPLCTGTLGTAGAITSIGGSLGDSPVTSLA